MLDALLRLPSMPAFELLLQDVHAVEVDRPSSDRIVQRRDQVVVIHNQRMQFTEAGGDVLEYRLSLV